jgi:hypothetical protein
MATGARNYTACINHNPRTRYPLLRVDSLCIIQDDPEDVTLEISRKPSVYRNATVTIAASRAKNVFESLLRDRPSPDVIFQLPCLPPGEEMGLIQLFPNASGGEEEEPLDCRGLALQECLLSTRILDYGTCQVRWMCKGAEEGDYYPL